MCNGELKDLGDGGAIVPVEIVSVSDVNNIRASLKAKSPKEIKETDLPMTLETPMDNAENEGEFQKKVEETSADTGAIKVAEISDDEAADSAESDAPTKPKAIDLDSLSALVNKVRDQAPEKNQQIALQSETDFIVFAENALAGIGEGTEMTVDEQTALQSAMYKCWNEPKAAPNPELLIVPVKVKLFPDGYVESVKLGAFIPINDYHKIAANDAIRAVNKCQPYDFLPEEKYSQWKDMTLNFRPEV